LQSLCKKRFGLKRRGALTVFNTYIRPVLTWGVPAWAGAAEQQWRQLEVAQNQALRAALRLPSWSNVRITRALGGVTSLKDWALSLAADWLHRAVDHNNLVGQEARLEDNFGKRYHYGTRQDPLGTIFDFDDARHR
jgi:hypothetical protein